MTRIGLVFLIAVLGSPAFAYAQNEAKQTPVEQVRVKTKHANIQAGPTSGADVLVLAPRGTVLKVLERKGPWVTVELTPELRNTATPMRWYKNESRGFIHDSQLEPAKGGLQQF
jgi:hypothetical protein